MENYYDLREIGRGKFGRTYRAKRIKDSQVVALKVIKYNTERDLKQIQKEINTLKKLSKSPACYPFIVCYYEVFYDKTNKEAILEMEYIDGWTLGEFKKQIRQKYSDEYWYYILLLLAKDLATPIDYIHQRGILHNDIKSDNIMISKSTYTPILIDFGLACTINFHKNTQGMCKTRGGTPYYLPPEAFKTGTRTSASDMWSLGVTLYKEATGMYLFPYVTTVEGQKYKILHDEIPKINTTYPLLNDVVNSLLKMDPSKRLTAAKLAHMLEEIPRVEPTPKEIPEYLKSIPADDPRFQSLSD